MINFYFILNKIKNIYINMFKKTNLFKINKFNFFKNFTIHKVGDSKDLEIVEKRYPLIKQLSPTNYLTKEFDDYTIFIVKNKGLEIDDNNGKYISETEFFNISLYKREKISRYILPDNQIKYLKYKFLSKKEFIVKFKNELHKRNRIESSCPHFWFF